MCEAFLSFHVDVLTCLPVYRVHWVRSAARYERWKEEKELLEHEMQWVILYFNKQGQMWKDRAATSVGDVDMTPDARTVGERCYAFKQAELWHCFEAQARKAFAGRVLEAESPI